MRVCVVSSDQSSVAWLEGVLRSAGLTVVVLPEADAATPEVSGCDLLIADSDAAIALGTAGPDRRLLLVRRGATVGLQAAMGGGFMDIIGVPAPEDEVLARVGRAVDKFLRPVTVPSDAGQRTAELLRMVERANRTLEQRKLSAGLEVCSALDDLLAAVFLLIGSQESAGRAAPGHSIRTGTLAGNVALALGIGEVESRWLGLAGRLHDVGMVPLAVGLSSTGPLTMQERRLLERHVGLSEEILAPLERWGFPLDAVSAHHERVDGSGYPRGLRGDAVIAGGQVLGVADVYEALTSPRPWRPAVSRPEALTALGASGGFSPDVVEAVKVATSGEV